MHLFSQKINWRAIFGQIGLLLHVPAVMALITIVICIIFGEWFAILPFGVIGVLGIVIGQALYHMSLRAKAAHLWDAMVIAALGWICCSVVAAIPLWWVAQIHLSLNIDSEVMQVFSDPVNSLFEAFSGFTSTGLTMMQREGPFPHALQWWRSFLQWTGGLGLVVFVLALTHLNKQGYQLYYAEARSEQVSNDITRTANWICGIYFLFTLLACGLFYFAGMPTWEAINHGMTAISTGGFTITSTNFQGYSTTIELIAIFVMIIGSISFAVHFQVIHDKNWKILWKSTQHRLLYILVIGGGGLVILLNFWNGNKGHYLHSFFEWTSALTTCGYSSLHLSFFSPMVRLLLIIGMFIGGATGSTAGGLKIRRIIYLFQGLFLRLTSITNKNEEEIVGNYQPSRKPPEEEPPGTQLPPTEDSERLFTAVILFSLWAATVFLGWFLVLKWSPKGSSMDALFDVTSAMSNVGLTSGFLTPEFSTFGKFIFMFMMWVGRLEIIPAIVLLLSIPMTIKSCNGKEP